MLGNILGRQDFLPHALGQLVAAVGSLPAVPREGLEEQVAALAPQALRIGAGDDFRERYVRQQYLPGLRWNAQRFQRLRTAEQRQVALVRIQGMCLRMRRQHDGPGGIGVVQRPAFGGFEHEVGQAVVHQVDPAFAQAQHAVPEGQRRRIRDQCVDAVTGEQALEQQELGVQILLFRHLVHDGDRAQRPAAVRQRPLGLEHAHDRFLEHGAGNDGAVEPRVALATLAVRPGHRDVQHGPARIRVYFDQSKAVAARMEVIPEKGAPGPARVEPGDFRGLRQDALPVGRHGHHGLDGTHDIADPHRLRVRHEHRP
jgi:hypothetical protein